MKNKGFTLIEILAIIIILGVTLEVVVPGITKLNNKIKQKAFETTVNGYLKTINIDNLDRGGLENNYTLTKGKIINDESGNNIKIKSGAVDNGYISINYKGNTTGKIYNQKYCTIIVNNRLESCDKYVEKILYGVDPVLDDNMIPVTLENDGTVKKADLYSEWYKYDDNDTSNNNSKWANAILVSNESREKYKKAYAETLIDQKDIRAYLVWIPRYKYAIPTVSSTSNPPLINIIFENKNTSKSNGDAKGTNYYTHPAFTFGDKELNGFWVGKFETTVDSSSSCGSCTDSNDCPTKCKDINSNELSILPNTRSLRYQSVNTQFNTAQKFNDYGLSNNSHLMKDSEWGAIAYLSHSKYGSNKEIRINNNSKYITGCGASSADASGTTTCAIQYGKATNYPQSTNGNISGIFDMSGGAFEYVMGNYQSAVGSSEFETLPEPKYYNLYNSDTYETACNEGLCKGYANYETKSWYGDSYYAVSSSYPWSLRSGGYNNASSSGIFYTHHDIGKSYASCSFHLVYSE